MRPKPFFAFQWHITEDCDQRCKHCYIFAENGKKEIAAATWDRMQDVVANCEDFCIMYHRRPYFYITGGDPILHPDFWKLMELLKEKEIPFTILGNPFHLTDEVCRRLRECGCDKYQLSIDGMRQTHDWFRMPGSFDVTLEKIATIRSAGIKAVIMTTVSDQNADELCDIIDTVVAHEADVFAFARYVPTYSPGESGEGRLVGMKPADYRALLARVDAKCKAYEADERCHTWFNRKDHLWTLYQYEIGEFVIPRDAKPGMIYGGCNCGNSHITILPDGEVLACRRVSESSIGNIYEDRLADLWVTTAEAYRQFGEFTKCAHCKLLAWCRGCPAVAKGTYGDFYAEDPQCWMAVQDERKGVRDALEQTDHADKGYTECGCGAAEGAA